VKTASLSANDWAVLGTYGEGPKHGYAVSRLLDEDGPIGHVWTLERSEVYAVVRKLSRLELIREKATEPGNAAPTRTVYAITASGRRALRKWLCEPVDHVRDVRALLLLKLLLLDRSGSDPAELIEKQVAKLRPLLESLEAARDGAAGFDRVLAQWRHRNCQATMEFLSSMRHY
jgi:DNA-binding PadR family transcriptional regulator